jgi:hypothetical protein
LPLFLINCTTTPPDIAVFRSLTQRLSHDPLNGHLILTPDPVCEKEIKEIECGFGVYIISKRRVFVGEQKEHWFKGKPWSQLKKESILLPAVESYAPLSKYIIDSCKELGCNDQVDRFKVQLDQLNNIEPNLNPKGE